MKLITYKPIDIRSLLIGAISCALIFTFLGHTSSNDEIICKSLKVINDNGSTILHLSELNGGGTVDIYNKAGKPIAYIGNSDMQGGFLRFFNDSENEIVYLGNLTNGGGGLWCFDKFNAKMVYIGNVLGAGGGMWAYNNTGQKAIYCGVGTDNLAQVSIYGPNDNILSTLSNGYLKTYGDNGQSTVYVGTTSNNSGLIQIFNTFGSECAYIGSATDDGGALKLLDKAGNLIFTK